MSPPWLGYQCPAEVISRYAEFLIESGIRSAWCGCLAANLGDLNITGRPGQTEIDSHYVALDHRRGCQDDLKLYECGRILKERAMTRATSNRDRPDVSAAHT